MNISRLLAGALVVCALPALAQPDEKPDAKPSFPRVTPEDAGKLGLTEKPMTFHLHDATLQEALNELQKQSGVPLDFRWGGGDQLQKKLSLDLETRSFNEAFRAMLDEADVKAYLEHWGGNVSWHLQFGDKQDEPNALQSGTGVFQVRASSLNFNLNRSITLAKTKTAKPSQSESLSVSLTFPSDPQLPIVRTPRVRITRAEDEAGHSVRKTEENPNYFGGGFMDRTEVALLVPAKTSHKIAHLEGVATFLLASRKEHWEVPDILNAKNPTHTFQSNGQQVTASIVSVEKKRGALQMDFLLSTQGGFNANAGQTLEDRNPLFSFERLGAAITLRGANGTTLTSGGYSGSGSENSYTLRLSFPLPLPDLKLRDDNAAPATEPFAFVLDAPTEFVQTEVPFSFSDLPLP